MSYYPRPGFTNSQGWFEQADLSEPMFWPDLVTMVEKGLITREEARDRFIFPAESQKFGHLQHALDQRNETIKRLQQALRLALR